MWFDFSIPRMYFEKTEQFGLVLKEQKNQEWGIRVRKDWESGVLEGMSKVLSIDRAYKGKG